MSETDRPVERVPPESILRRRLRKFQRLKRGYYAFLLIVAAYVVSFFLPFLMTNVPPAVKYRDQYYFPMFR